ncbi:MAG: hypothetical protein ABIU09_10225 [Pyrinomonadaceae bacterium]
MNGDDIYRQKVLEANHPDFIEPTLGVIVGNDPYFLANGQLAFVNKKAELDNEKLRSPVVLKLDAKKPLAK